MMELFLITYNYYFDNQFNRSLKCRMGTTFFYQVSTIALKPHLNG